MAIKGSFTDCEARHRTVAIRSLFVTHVLKLYQERYSDYGPTLFSEVLSESHHITIDSDTLRRWLKGAKLWNGARAAHSTVGSVPGVKLLAHFCNSTVVFTTGLKAEDQSVVSWLRSMMPPEKSSSVFQHPRIRQMSFAYSRVTSSAMGFLISSTPTMARYTTITITVKPMWPVPSHPSALSLSTLIHHKPRDASNVRIALIRIVSSKPSAVTTSQPSMMPTDTSKNHISTNIISALPTPKALMTFTVLLLVSISKISSALRLRANSITTRPSH